MYGVGPSEDTGRIKDGFENIYRSEYFKTALSTNVGDNSKSINVSEFSFEVLSIAVDFMYGIEIPESFNKSEDLKSLLHLADLYLMEDLKTAAGLLIACDLNKDNVFDVSLLADKFKAEALRNKCVDYLFDNASSIDGEKFSVLSEGAVMASLAKKFVLETKKPARRPLWITKLFGEEPDFKKREDFASLVDYDYDDVSKIQRGMFVAAGSPPIGREFLSRREMLVLLCQMQHRQHRQESGSEAGASTQDPSSLSNGSLRAARQIHP